jgi:hypothetical protein
MVWNGIVQYAVAEVNMKTQEQRKLLQTHDNFEN